MNLLALIIFSLLYANFLRWFDWLLITIICGLLISFAIFLLNPDVTAYVGFSGLIHSLFFYIALIFIRKKYREGWIIFALLGGKLIWEQFVGALPGSELTAGGPVLVDAHLYGAVSGILLASIVSWYTASSTK